MKDKEAVAINKALSAVLNKAAENGEECPALRQSLDFVIKLKHEILVEDSSPVPKEALAVEPTGEEVIARVRMVRPRFGSYFEERWVIVRARCIKHFQKY